MKLNLWKWEMPQNFDKKIAVIRERIGTKNLFLTWGNHKQLKPLLIRKQERVVPHRNIGEYLPTLFYKVET